MKSHILILINILIICCFIKQTHCGDDGGVGWMVDPNNETDILIITTSNYNQSLAAHKHLVILYYASWCKYSRNFAPEYVKLDKMLHDLGSRVKLGQVDVDAEEELQTLNNIQGLPALYYYANGERKNFYRNQDLAVYVLEWLKINTGVDFLISSSQNK